MQFPFFMLSETTMSCPGAVQTNCEQFATFLGLVNLSSAERNISFSMFSSTLHEWLTVVGAENCPFFNPSRHLKKPIDRIRVIIRHTDKHHVMLEFL